RRATAVDVGLALVQHLVHAAGRLADAHHTVVAHAVGVGDALLGRRAFRTHAAAAIDIGLGAVLDRVGAGRARALSAAAREGGAGGAAAPALLLVARGPRAAAIDVRLGAVLQFVVAHGGLALEVLADLREAIGVVRARLVRATGRAFYAAAIEAGLVP